MSLKLFPGIKIQMKFITESLHEKTWILSVLILLPSFPSFSSMEAAPALGLVSRAEEQGRGVHTWADRNLWRLVKSHT